MKAEIKMEPHIVCPNCGDGKGFSCEHILSDKDSRSFGPWYCDSCGHAISGHRDSSGSIEIEQRAGRKITTLDILVLKPQEKPLYFVVEGMRFEGEPTVIDKLRNAVANLEGKPTDNTITIVDESEEHRHKQFYYDEHSCPTNWLKPVLMYFDGDNDPHGVIEFVKYRDAEALPPDENWGPNDRDFALVELIEDHNKAKA